MLQKRPTIVIDGINPRLDRGASLDYRPENGTIWNSVSFHNLASDALIAFFRLPHHVDNAPSHYRIRVHQLDCDISIP
jgi:hypothetical protein